MSKLGEIEPEVAGEFVSVNHRTSGDVLTDEIGKRLAGNVLDCLERIFPDVRTRIPTTGVLLAAPRPRGPYALPPV
jgi:hypothetical protein